MRKKHYQGLLAKLYGLTYHEILIKLYVEEDKSIREVAKELSLSVGTVHRDLNEEGIKKKLKWQ